MEISPSRLFDRVPRHPSFDHVQYHTDVRLSAVYILRQVSSVVWGRGALYLEDTEVDWGDVELGFDVSFSGGIRGRRLGGSQITLLSRCATWWVASLFGDVLRMTL